MKRTFYIVKCNRLTELNSHDLEINSFLYTGESLMYLGLNFLISGMSWLIFGFLNSNQALGAELATREPAFARIPKAQNEKMVVQCLSRLKGYITDAETSSVDSLKTKVERVYGLRKSMIYYRELIYRNSASERWRVEFYLIGESKWGNEKFRLKFYKASRDGDFMPTHSPSGKEEIVDKDGALKYAQFEEILSDERWERFLVPGDPSVNYKMKDFKLFELNVISKKPKSNLSCVIAGGFPHCICNHPNE